MSNEESRPVMHPAPQRKQVHPARMLYAVFASPAGWSLEELIGWGLANVYCGGSGEVVAPQLARGHMPAFIVLTVVAVALCASGTWVALRAWQDAREEKVGSQEKLGEQGEGRTRFTTLWALMTSAAFLVALLFQMVELWAVPLCPQ